MGAFVRADGLAASDTRYQRSSGSTLCVAMAGDGCGPKLARDEGLMVLVGHLSAVRYTESREAFRCAFWHLCLEHVIMVNIARGRTEECGLRFVAWPPMMWRA
jgi:hypothetical protein